MLGVLADHFRGEDGRCPCCSRGEFFVDSVFFFPSFLWLKFFFVSVFVFVFKLLANACVVCVQVVLVGVLRVDSLRFSVHLGHIMI